MRPVHGDRHWLVMCLAGSVLVIFLVLGAQALAALLTATVVFVLVRRAALSRLHGFTGDVAGALVELVETVLLVALALMVGN